MESFQSWVSEKLGFTLSAKQIDQFRKYLELLQEWNQQVNLVADAAAETVIQRHFLDSLTCLQSGIIEDSITLLDIGAGAGFPGIPLKIVIPQIRLTLIESIQKKCRFLDEAVNTLELAQTDILCDRAEKLARLTQYREQYKVVVTRALAQLPVAVELALPFVQLQGTYLAMLGSDADEQIAKSRIAISLCGGMIEQLIPIDIPNSDRQRYLVLIKKSVHTSQQYPRRAGIPQKRPLVISS
ncbi:MAG: 16S rRNA (guanine(527)-N(7))-methyltransferase RsmG [bacterium]|nr:16S rRNA (guanine(527)-N(7))-methyltransferase RsmG [bacterium]